MAIKNKSVLNPNYDVIEAWKYGPVIPCLYNELKIFGSYPITEQAKILIPSLKENSPFEIRTPKSRKQKD